MKSAWVVPAAVGVVSLLSFSCEESFSPKTKFQGRNVLFCIIETDLIHTTDVTATVSRLYDVDGPDLSVNKVDPAVVGATVTLTINNGVSDRVYLLTESSRPRADTSRYAKCQRFYSVKGISVHYYDRYLRMTAHLPGGDSLVATTTVPHHALKEGFPPYPRGVTTRLDPLKYGKAWIIDWDDSFDEQHLFFPKLVIYWKKVAGPTGVAAQGVKEVPLQYVKRGDQMVPIYPSYSERESCSYDFAAIDSAMAQISAGDPNKGDYIVSSIVFRYTEFDSHLSRYYSSVNGSLDQYSVRVDETVYTNVVGGLGIFGSCYSETWGLPLEPGYVKSFGYRAK